MNESEPTSPSSSSPPWNNTLKLVAGLTVMAIITVLLIYFRSLVGPLLLAFIIIYLLHPVTVYFSKVTRLSWRASANIVFILLVLVLAGLSTWAGVAVAQQVQSLVKIVQRFVTDLPTILDNLSQQVYTFGPYTINPGQILDVSNLSQQLISTLQTLVTRAGTLVSSFATGAASMIGWGLFAMLVAYFVLADAGQVPDAINFIQIPGYDADVRRMAQELGRVWNAFLRGQLLIISLVIVAYTILMSILGVRYALGLAILAGLARFFPYVGPFVTMTVTFLVTVFQPENYFGLAPIHFALLVIVSCFVLDQVFDNLVSPLLMGQSLGVHPAAVLIAAIVAANLIGIVGLVMAAPVLASLSLIGQYIGRKMFDQDPWPNKLDDRQPLEFPRGKKIWNRARAWWRKKIAKKPAN